VLVTKWWSGLTLYFSKLVDQLNGLVDLVQEPLTDLQRISVGALIVIDVHAKDVVDKLIKEKINSILEFEWIS